MWRRRRSGCGRPSWPPASFWCRSAWTSAWRPPSPSTRPTRWPTPPGTPPAPTPSSSPAPSSAACATSARCCSRRRAASRTCRTPAPSSWAWSRTSLSPDGGGAHSGLRQAGSVAVELGAAEAAALEIVADRVRRQLGLGGQRLLAPVLGAAGRAVAQLPGAVVVPPAALVVGGAVEDLEAHLRVLQADADQLHEVLGADPDRQAALVDGPVADVADPEAQHAQAVLLGVEGAERLAERLAHAVARVGPHRDVGADAVMARVEPHRVVGGSEHHPLDALAARRLEQVVAADDVGLQDRLPRAFHRVAAQVDDAVDAVDDALHLLDAGEVGGNERLVVGEVGGLPDVAQAKVGVDGLQEPAQARADVARGAGEQDARHVSLLASCVVRPVYGRGSAGLQLTLGQPAVALQAAREVHAHGAAGAGGVTGADRRVDAAVLLLDARQVLALRL